MSSVPSSTSSHPIATFEPPALTTTFIPPPQCTADHLTMLANQDFRIFLNEPLPVPGTTITDCYPSQFGNSWLLSAAGTSLPAFSPLVCPQNYQTVLNGTDNYIACCPSGYLLAQPSTVISSRSAFGGTCYTPITSVTVTSYNNSTLGGTTTFSTATSAQAYAYPIDGFALLKSPSTATATSTPSSTTSSQVSATASNSTHSSSSSTHLSSGAIAGIVLAGLAFLLLLLTTLLLFIRNHKLRSQLSQRAGYGNEARDIKEMHGTSRPVELPDTSPTEVDGQSFLVQLDGQSSFPLEKKIGTNWCGKSGLPLKGRQEVVEKQWWRVEKLSSKRNDDLLINYYTQGRLPLHFYRDFFKTLKTL